MICVNLYFCFFFFQAEDGIRDRDVTGVQTCLFRSRDPPQRVGPQQIAEDHQREKPGRSEERRVGKECRSRWGPDHVKKKEKSLRKMMELGIMINKKARSSAGLAAWSECPTGCELPF